jgi:hypothetical protein
VRYFWRNQKLVHSPFPINPFPPSYTLRQCVKRYKKVKFSKKGGQKTLPSIAGGGRKRREEFERKSAVTSEKTRSRLLELAKKRHN